MASPLHCRYSTVTLQVYGSNGLAGGGAAATATSPRADPAPRRASRRVSRDESDDVVEGGDGGVPSGESPLGDSMPHVEALHGAERRGAAAQRDIAMWAP